LKHPPDLLSFLSVEVPVLPLCTLNSLQRGSTGQQLGLQPCDGSPCPGISRLMPGSQRYRTTLNGSNPALRCPQSESLVETGLIGNEHRMVAIGTPPTTANTLCPGRHVLADICLPINTEGMLPRLWETRQRLIELNNSVDPFCLAWARTVLYTLMPHPMAGWLEANFGGSAKASVSFTGVEVVSPFSSHTQPKEHDPSVTYQMPPTRRLAYMSSLASKSAEARSLRRRLRRRLPRGALVCPPRLGTSFRALARHLTNANAGLVYIAGSPVIRIDTWMPSPRLAGDLTLINGDAVGHSTSNSADTTNWALCRDLSVAFTTYAGQLSLTFCANSAMDNDPNLDLILQAVRTQLLKWSLGAQPCIPAISANYKMNKYFDASKQVLTVKISVLRKMCRLLAGRHVPTATDRWLYRSSSMETRAPSPSTALSLSPSLNPSLVLRTDSNATTSIESTADTRSGDATGHGAQSGMCKTVAPASVSDSTYANLSDRSNPSKTQTKGSQNSVEQRYHTSREMSNFGHGDGTGVLVRAVSSSHTPGQMANQISIQTYACQSGQPTEQLQDRLQWVQQQLNDAASSTPTHSTRKRLTDQELVDLRNEFCALLRELKQRCSLGNLGITPEMAKSISFPTSDSPDHRKSVRDGRLAVTHPRSVGHSPTRVGQTKFNFNEVGKSRSDFDFKPKNEGLTISSGIGKTIATRGSASLETVGDRKRNMTTPIGGDFDEDPDFYIDAYGDDDEEEEFEDDEDDLEDSEKPVFPIQSCGSGGSLHIRPPIAPPTPDQSGREIPFGTEDTMNSSEPSIRPDNRDLSTPNIDSYHPKSKRRRTSATSSGGRKRRRSSSLLSTDVTSFDLIPNRRGSLGSGGTCSTRSGPEGLLSKLVRGRLGGLISNSRPNSTGLGSKSCK
uniref:WS_DGAT_C domain-containing protein n=1 Tax=Echinostoma caproni TaxID=27848 RepID=A0A183AQY6_9TREM